MTGVKICGLKDSGAVSTAVEGGASHVGFVFFPPSPRAVDPETAGRLVLPVPDSVCVVGLFVDPDDALLRDVLSRVRIDCLQLHGHETPERVAEIRDLFGKRVLKAIPVATGADLHAIEAYAPVSDALLFDAKLSGTLPGGNGISFDWTLLQDVSLDLPWFLAGGLTPENVGQAISLLHPDIVDVSSGVERAPGLKDPVLIRRFLEAVRSAV